MGLPLLRRLLLVFSSGPPSPVSLCHCTSGGGSMGPDRRDDEVAFDYKYWIIIDHGRDSIILIWWVGEGFLFFLLLFSLVRALRRKFGGLVVPVDGAHET
jgi:hypothetical protein